jgi:peptide/nickel transport system substrate-binding protein
MHRWQRISLVSIGLLFVTSCAPSNNPGGTATSDDGDRITVGTTKKPRTLDPADAYELRSIALIRNLSDRLYTYDPGSTTLKPQLATALPQVSADGLTYTIPLRQGVLFHDGTDFNAAAMKFSLDRFIGNKGKPSFLLAERVASVEASSNYELIIKLKKPFAAFASMLAFPGTCALSPTAYKEQVGENKFEANKFVGTGPYKLAEYSSDRVKFDVFDRYWGAKPLNRGVSLQIFNNNAANLYNSFRTGGVDVAYQSLEPDQVKSLDEGAKADKWQSIALEGSVTSYLILNVLQEPLNNPLVRQALAAVVDRPLMNERILYGQGKPLYSVIPSTFSVSQPVFKKDGDGNIDRAKQLLTQAGFSASKPARIQIWYPSSSTSNRLTAGLLRAYAKKKLGGMLEIEPNTIEASSFYKYVSKNMYPATLQDWYPDFLDPDNFVQPFLECPTLDPKTKGCGKGGTQSQGSFYYSEAMNQLIADQGKELDPIKRQKIYADIQQRVQADVPLIPLWQTKDFAFAKKGMTGISIDPLQNLLYSGMKK